MSFLTRRHHYIRALFVLPRHFVRIPELSFLPEPERDRRDLARQGHFGQFLSYTSTDTRLIDLFQWPRLGCSRIRSPFEHILEHRVVIAVQPTGQRRSPPASQLPADELLIGTRARHHSQPDVGPQLPLGPEPPRRAHDRQHQSYPNRTEERYRSQHLPSRLASPLRDHGRFGLRPQLEQAVKLLQQRRRSHSCP